MKAPSKKNLQCEHCDECEYVGEGGYLCTAHNEIVIEDWEPTDEYMHCDGADYIRG